MNVIQITIRCVNHPDKHAKMIRIHEELGLAYAEALAGLLDGSSAFYVRKPGPLSPLGKCAICDGRLTSVVEEVEVDGA